MAHKLTAPKEGAKFCCADSKGPAGRAKDPNFGKSGNSQIHAHEGEKASQTSGKVNASGKFVAPKM